MADMIKVPGFGPTKKTTVYLVGGVVVLVAAVGFYRTRQAGAAAPAAGTDQTDQTLQDQLDQAAAYGAGGYGGGGASVSDSSSTASTGYTTNGAWSQAAEDYLVNTVHSGENADTIGNALGKYITGQALTSDQVVIVEQAIAFIGYPPVNGSTGYPPSYRTTAATTTAKPGWAYGLKVTRTTATSATFSWKAATNATAYNIYLNGVKVHSTADLTYTLSGLKHSTAYTIGVQPYGAGGTGPISHTTAHTKKK